MNFKPDYRCWAEVSGPALRHNIRTIRSLIPRATQIMAVVKANAYGHGIQQVGRECGHLGVDWFGVANVTEARLLRNGGVTQPILLLSPALPAEYPEAVRIDAHVTISNLDEARMLRSAARQADKIARVHVKIDTGMGRLGAWPEDVHMLIKKIKRMPDLRIEGLYSHFAGADEDAAMTRRQWRIFEKARLEVCEQIGIGVNSNGDTNSNGSKHPFLVHLANSPAVLTNLPCTADLIRTGVLLYGVAGNSRQRAMLRPALTWKTRVTLVRHVPPGHTISYGATYRTKRPEMHAVVAIGYGDGYMRTNSNNASVLINGKRCPLRGRVTMDNIIVDVTHAGKVKPGDEVVVLGAQKGGVISASDLAKWSGTINYEVLTNISSRVPRVYRSFKT